MWVCDRKLYRTKEGQMVEEGDQRAHVLLFSPGDVLASEPVVQKLEKPPSSTAAKKASAQNAKAVKPVDDKAIKPEEDKGEE
jgi:hypothetical protein